MADRRPMQVMTDVRRGRAWLPAGSASGWRAIGGSSADADGWAPRVAARPAARRAVAAARRSM